MSQIRICDYCKQPKTEFKEVKINDESFDFCNSCYEVLYKHLKSPVVFSEPSHSKISRSKESSPIREESVIVDLDNRDEKIKALEDGEVEPEPKRERLNKSLDSNNFSIAKDGECLHLNKGRIEDVAKKPYRKCLNCGEKIYIKSKS